MRRFSLRRRRPGITVYLDDDAIQPRKPARLVFVDGTLIGGFAEHPPREGQLSTKELIDSLQSLRRYTYTSKS